MTTNTTSLRDEILGEMIKADNNGLIHSSNYGRLTDEILSIFEKRIDLIKVQYMEYYAVPDLINEIKEMLKS